MRITGGEYAGRKLAAIKGWSVRPTPSQVREAIFSILGQDFAGLSVLDLFAGSGVLSFEAISRGCEYAVMVDRSPKAMEVIRKNADILGVRDRVRVLRSDIEKGLNRVEALKRLFDVVFLDPPYGRGLAESTIQSLDRSSVMKPLCVVVAEHAREDLVSGDRSRLKHLEMRAYGQSSVSFFRYEFPEPKAGIESFAVQ